MSITKELCNLDMLEKTMSQYGISRLPCDTSYAMAYVPFQSYSPKLFSAVQGYEMGTMFESLNKQFYGAGCDCSK